MYGPSILHMLSASVHFTVANSFDYITNLKAPSPGHSKFKSQHHSRVKHWNDRLMVSEDSGYCHWLTFVSTCNKRIWCLCDRASYRVSQEECEILRESVPYVKLYRYNPKHLYPKLNGYGDNSQRSLKLWQLLTHLLITKYILKLAGICGFCNVNICTWNIIYICIWKWREVPTWCNNYDLLS